MHSITECFTWESEMNKATNKQVDRFVAMAARDPRYAANGLAILQRSATTNKTSNEIADIIKETGLFRYLDVINGCFVPQSN
jgi:5'(3')-deoxyribonucleotidase